jgi:hypothetical protein
MSAVAFQRSPVVRREVGEFARDSPCLGAAVGMAQRRPPGFETTSGTKQEEVEVWLVRREV